eukprot:141989-Chlamydomonas_euryale.AAC.1
MGHGHAAVCAARHLKSVEGCGDVCVQAAAAVNGLLLRCYRWRRATRCCRTRTEPEVFVCVKGVGVRTTRCGGVLQDACGSGSVCVCEGGGSSQSFDCVAAVCDGAPHGVETAGVKAAWCGGMWLRKDGEVF